ncbi:MAG: MBL fold metallo-hydrolase [Pseudomonadota bacterium]|jgi:L-ascorbate metabolism protein UlaG (beta-lactamase superfamily)
MKWLKRIGVILIAVIAAGAGAGYWLLNDRPSLQPYEKLIMPPAANAPGEVRVSFLGVATLLIADGETAIMTDGYFSRPNLWQILFGEVSPDREAIAQGLQKAGVSRLAAVIPVHSHYDHAMDSPEVALRTGAVLIGSESSANIGRGWGMDETQIRLAKTGEPMQFGQFTVTLYPSRHAPAGFTGGEIGSPLKPPAGAFDYKEGASYAILVQHKGKSLLINGSAGFEPGALKDVRADVVFLGTGGIGNFNPQHEQDYWNETVRGAQAKRVIAIHWDDFMTTAPGAPPAPPSYLLGDRLMGSFDSMMAWLQANGEKDDIEIRLPAAWRPMDVWVGLQ